MTVHNWFVCRSGFFQMRQRVHPSVSDDGGDMYALQSRTSLAVTNSLGLLQVFSRLAGFAVVSTTSRLFSQHFTGFQCQRVVLRMVMLVWKMKTSGT